MTILELYEQFCKNYHEENYAALLALLQDNAALLSTATVVFPTKEAFENVAVAERPKFSYIAEIQTWHIATTDPITIIEDKDNLFLKLLTFKAMIFCDIDFLNRVNLAKILSQKDDPLLAELLSESEIKALLPWAIMDGSSNVLHILLKQFLLKTNKAFSLDEPLVDGLTALELLAKSDNGPSTIFTKKTMLFYAAAWDYFVGSEPTIENIHRLPCFFSLSQPVDNIEKFLNLQTVKADDNPFFDKGGLCEGLSCLHDWYAAQGRLDYYFMTIALLNIWDGTAEQLNKPLPAILPQALFYRTLGELFQQWTNDILLFQGNNIDTLLLKPEIKSFYSESKGFQLQGAQTNYFSLVKPKEAVNTQLVCIENQTNLNIRVNLTQEQFDECLSYFIKIPHVYIQVGKNNHLTSIRPLMDQEQFDHFNSNRRFISRHLESMDVLKESIKNDHPKKENSEEYQGLLVYRYDGPMHKKPWAENHIFETLPETTEEAELFQKNSTNRFTHLHVAVMVQDTETVKKILAAKIVDISATDFHECSAMGKAIENAYWEGTELLLADPRIQPFALTWTMMNNLIIYEHEDFILRLIQHEKVRYSVCDFLELSLRYNSTKIIQDIKEAFLRDPQGQRSFLLTVVKIFFCTHKEDFAKELFAFMAQNLSKEEVYDVLNGVRATKGYSDEKATLLHRAILERDYSYAKFLIEKGADLSVPIQGGVYTGTTARQLLEEHGKLELIPEKDRSLEQNIQVKAEKGYRFFSTVAKRMDDRLQEKINTFATVVRF